ncbi:threonine--tRNA ligase [candidate division WWE3 bacterium]|nr:threonine--tRNA ligase [candidate division WWE3 bacterium]
MKNNEYLLHLRHTSAHLLAAAVLELWPETKQTIGPAIDTGFYYDFEFAKPITEEDLPKIEAKMAELLNGWFTITHREVSPEEAKQLFSNNQYKHELIDEFASEGQTLTVYTSGSYTDLCRGGHVEHPAKEIGGFKLLSIAGAYWRGDEKNKMLTRIYGTAFPTKNELEKYLAELEEAKKRDHRKIGKELDLFAFSDLVGAGLPLFTPNGTIIRMELQNALFEISRKYSVLPVTIPHLAKIKLYETSGHAQKFAGELFRVISHYDEEFVMKPVNCPHHTQIYASQPRSYRDLPLRYMESTMQYRDEKPGEIGGLTRVRSITCDDGHTFCTVDQIKEEAQNICRIIEEFYTGLGLFGNHWVSLSVRDPQKPDAYIGEPADWERAEMMLQLISDQLGLNAIRQEGEAAIYGPKLDYMFKDSLGKERQLATVQIDFAMPKRFGLTYIDQQGSEQTPVMLHRAILGSYERFLAILIEHFAGAFPLWLHPTQVALIPISENQLEYARAIEQKIRELMPTVRLSIDTSNETLQKKIRNAQMLKTPYMLVIGGKEQQNNTVNVRLRTGESLGELTPEEFAKRIVEKTNQRSLDL